MTIPRTWTHIKLQRSTSQQEGLARPAATDSRFKAAAFFAVCAWLVIFYSIRHSIHHYKPRNRGLWKSFNGFFHYVPTRFIILITLVATHISYAILSAFDFNVSPLKYDSNPGWIYGLGYLPVILVILVMEVWGYISENEDLQIIEQRRDRNREADAALNITRKPRWWRNQQDWFGGTQQGSSGDPTCEIGGGRAAREQVGKGLEMGTMTAKPNATSTTRTDDTASPTVALGVQRTEGGETDGTKTRTESTRSMGIATQGKVRSMLDV
jgi:hypothetical protein